MTKIAVPTREDRVDDHFGHCAYYTIFTVNEKQILDQESLPSPQGCGCKSNIASTLHEMGVTLMLAGNMGEGAKNKLREQGITVIRGCSGVVTELIHRYLQGAVVDSGIACLHHDCP